MSVPLLPEPGPVPETPWGLVGARPTRTARKAVALSLCERLEEQAAAQVDPPIVLVTFQHDRFFTEAVAARYARLAATCPLVAVFGIDPSRDQPPGLRVVDIAADDPLREQWTIVIVGSFYTVAFIALDLGDDGPDCDRRFSFIVTYDRALAVDAGRSLFSRLN